jgi:hypothetical protein
LSDLIDCLQPNLENECVEPVQRVCRNVEGELV